MAWRDDPPLVSTTLALTGTFQIVQRSAADWELDLDPFEEAHIQFEFNPQTTPTELCQIDIQSSPDDIGGSPVFDDVAFAPIILPNSPDPVNRSIVLRGPRSFRFSAALIDTDGTVGGDDTGDLVVRVARNNVNAAQS